MMLSLSLRCSMRFARASTSALPWSSSASNSSSLSVPEPSESSPFVRFCWGTTSKPFLSLPVRLPPSLFPAAESGPACSSSSSCSSSSPFLVPLLLSAGAFRLLACCLPPCLSSSLSSEPSSSPARLGSSNSSCENHCAAMAAPLLATPARFSSRDTRSPEPSLPCCFLPFLSTASFCRLLDLGPSSPSSLSSTSTPSSSSPSAASSSPSSSPSMPSRFRFSFCTSSLWPLRCR
mmetsp:Transcript_18585/g.52243  ORF Transcript_18585/g.52243 Transcript_18585/m.52243 type:complete len:234 (+) Transcript_18585:737-1438(+)